MSKTLLAITILAAIPVIAVGQQGAPATQFRAATNLIRLDVSVLDKNRQPVRGLTAADFSISEDGKVQKVESFASVDVPDPVVATASWMRDIAPDVQTNQLDDRRMVVMVLDNWSGIYESWESKTGKQVARDIIDRLGPADVMSVVVVNGATHSQDFTADRALLKAAVEQREGDVYGHNRAVPMSDDFVNVLTDVTTYLKAIPHRRKALIYVGMGNMYVDPRNRDVQQRLVALTNGAMAANVNIYCFDLNGLRPPQMPTKAGDVPVFAPAQTKRDTLLAISNSTGGDATINTNRPTDGVPQLFVENGSYYLLGYQTTNPAADGKTRRLEVKVNRPDVQVRYRRSYRADLPASSKASAPPVVQSAIAAILPDRGVPMSATLSPFATPDLRSGVIAMAIRLQTSRDVATQNVEVLSRAFTPMGDARGEQLQAFRVPAGAKPGSDFDVLAQMTVPPGRYEFRLASHDVVANSRGSVYAYVEVPDFAKEPVSLSGVVFEDSQKLAGPSGALASVIPVVPTTRRAFVTTESGLAFFRVYQGLGRTLAPVSVNVSVTDSRDRVVAEGTTALDAAAFDTSTRSSDQRFPLPLTTLAPGDYLLKVQAALDAKVTIVKTVRFAVR